MSAFLKLAYELIATILRGFGGFFVSIGKAFVSIYDGFAGVGPVLKAYSAGFSVLQWIMTGLLLLVLLSIVVLLIVKIILFLKRRVPSTRQAIKEDDLLDEIASLNAQVADLVDEKSQIMAMKVSQLGLTPGADVGQAETTESGQPSRFAKLTQVDEQFEEFVPPEFDNDITLPEIVDRYINFAASKLHLYYNQRTIRLFLAGMAASKILILEGISGTGKTSLPYSFSKYLHTDAGIVSVQPSYRDRTELLGYFNEFTKRFNETEFLRYVYTANYAQNPSFVVLDEMNLARIEYYFAEMLSVLEMPTPEEWKIDLVPTAWDTDPKLIKSGKLQVPTNLWFVGTANNDDSTFTITDKVYDRAIPIQLNERAAAFEAPDTEPLYLSWEHLSALYDDAREKYSISEATLSKLDKLDTYLITRFKMAFGNRITKQMRDFVPVFVACGGTELDAIDYIIECKILKKFESLNISFMRDEMKELISFIDKTFGKNGLVNSKKYLTKLENMF